MDLDPFDDVFADQPIASRPGGRAGGKFQPKRNAKPRPKNPAPASNPAPGPNQAPSSTIPGNNQLNEKQGQLPPGSTNDGEWQSRIERSPGGKNCDVYIGLDSFEDSLPQTVTIPTETPTVHASDGQNAEDGLVDPGSCNTANVRTSLEGPAHSDTLMGEDSAVHNKGETFHLESRTKEAESADDFPCLNAIDLMSQPTSTSGQRMGKSQHNPMLHPCNTKQCDMSPNPEEIEYGSFADSVPSQTECMVENSGPAFPEDDVIDLSSIGLSDSIHGDATSDFQVNEERTNWTGTSHSDATLPGEHPESISEMPGKRTTRGRRKGPMSPDVSPEHQNASISVPEDNVGRSSGRLRKQTKTFQLFDEPDDEGCNDNHGLENEDNDNIDPEYVAENVDTDNVDPENVVENESLNGKPRSRSKKSDAKKEKPVRKRKKANEESVETTKAPKKKFSHTTRRNRRRVNPDLLKVPEDEIDFHNLPLTTRIWLAEHKERMEKSEATASETPLMNQSTASFSGYHHEDEASQGRDSADEYANSMVPEASTGFNYHTHMKITPRARWSKQDTELFYEVLQQFGTDLAMIAECFPGRTRHQIKLKYKSEERRNPARLHDALATRSKGSSHFEVVIERLQQIAAQKRDENGDDPINSTGEEADEVAADVNEAAKSELRGEKVQDMEPEDVHVPNPDPEVENSLKSDESEDDELRWSQYKSEI